MIKVWRSAKKPRFHETLLGVTARKQAATQFGGCLGVPYEHQGRAYLIRCDPTPGAYNFYVYAYKANFLDKHIQNASFGIRFINSSYDELFRLKDGESVVITTSDGEKITQPCRYIDQTHVEVGNDIYHICEFAEKMERVGSTYAPTAPPKKEQAKPKNQQKKKRDDNAR